MGIRDIRRDARQRVHGTFAVPALYIAAQGATPVPCAVRVWTRDTPLQVGDLPGFPGSAHSVEPEDRIRFKLSDLPSLRRVGAVVSVEAGEAYRCDHYYPVDDQYQTARVTRLTAAEAAALPVPA